MIVHICDQEKFIPSFIDLIESENLGIEQQYFICKGNEQYAITPRDCVTIVTSFGETQKMLRSMLDAEKIILHGLYFTLANQLLVEYPKLLPKCYWAMWGNDFYFPEQQPEERKKIIHDVGFCLTRNKGDYALAQQWYGTSAEMIDCVGYSSNVFSYDSMHLRSDDCIHVQLGNSSDPVNNHMSILSRLSKRTESNFKVFAPLSYGDDEHAERVATAGRRMLGERFVPMLEYLSLDEYHDYLKDIDIAIFNHRKQQAIGNIINLLGLGKKVYMRNDVTSWQSFSDDGLHIFDVNAEFTLDRLNEDLAKENHQLVSDIYSRERLIENWKNILCHNRNNPDRPLYQQSLNGLQTCGADSKIEGKKECRTYKDTKLHVDEQSHSNNVDNPETENAYQFTADWFLGDVYESGVVVDIPEIWRDVFKSFSIKTVLEIGSYEGRSSCFIGEVLGKIQPIRLYCVDTWLGSNEHSQHNMADVENRFDKNIDTLKRQLGGQLEHFEKMKTTSVRACAQLIASGMQERFDFIHIDGSHAACDVLTDAVCAFQLLKPGGLIIFDDYLWSYGYETSGNSLQTPKPAIDAFANCFRDSIEVLHGFPLYQLYAKKVAA